jgi:hypothetical protein
MTRKLIFSIVLCLCAAIQAKSQTWAHHYHMSESPGNILCYDFSNQNGGIICFEVQPSGPPTGTNKDYCLIRVNQNGDTLWTKKNHLNGPFRAAPKVVKQMRNGDYLIGVSLGDSVSSANDPIGTKFFRLDSNGNVIHSFSRGDNRNHGILLNVEINSDQGYYISYSYDSIYMCCGGQGSRCSMKSVIERFDSNNVTVWKRMFVNDFCYTMIGDLWCSQEWSNGYTFCRMRTIRTADDGIFYNTRDRIGKFRGDGTTEFDRAVGSDISGCDLYYDGFSTSDTGVVINLYGIDQYYLCKYNSSGTMINHISVPRECSFYAEGVEVASGKYIVSGGTNFPDSCGFYLFDKNLNKLDSVMKPSWDTSFQHAVLVRAGNGEAFYSGLARSAPTGYAVHAFAAKVDTLLNVHRHLQASLSSNCLVPGYTSHLDIVMHNSGNTVVDTTLVVILDSNAHYSSSSIAPFAISGDTLTFHIDSLRPDSLLNITAMVTVDSSIGLGTVLTFYAFSPFPNNIGITDDSVVYSNATVSSFDPNYKSVNKSFYFVPEGKSIIYTIGYENKGNYLARNIKIRDTIDTHLDPTTIRILTAAPMIPTIYHTADNEILFSLSDINLPDSATEPTACYGQFSFAIDMKEGLVVGDTIENTAHIIFDFNAPVVTNTTMNIISDHNGPFTDRDISYTGGLNAYPNPTSGLITIVLPSSWIYSSVILTDISGKVINTEYSSSNVLNYDLDLANGVYLISVTDIKTREVITRKIVVLR